MATDTFYQIDCFHYGVREYPNDAELLDALYEQAGSDENVKKTLVNNPDELYGFSENESG